jgi:hypothetical protein
MKRGLVLTSVNPKSRLDYQGECLAAWKDLGLRVVTCQASDEAEQVRGSVIGGVAEVFELTDAASARVIHRFPSPRVKPLLDLAHRHYKPDFLFIANSDIYPALRKRPLALFATHPAYAFARREVIALASGPRSTSMYRGGLDVFAFTHGGLDSVWKLLEKDEVAERMAFGVPGWDYYLAATLSRREVGGAIMDGPFFWHQSHKTAYGSVDRVTSYLPKLIAMGRVSSTDASVAAEEFVGYINSECDRNALLSRRMHLMYGSSRTANQATRKKTVPDAVIDLCRTDALLRRFEPDIADIHDYLLSSHVSLQGLQSHLLDSESIAVRFQQYLAVLYLVIRVRLCSGRISITASYSPSNARRSAVASNLRMNDFYERRFHQLDLFCNEFLVHRLLNVNDLKALALSCINDAERALMKRIIRTIKNEIATRRAESIVELALVEGAHGGEDECRRTLDGLVAEFNQLKTKVDADLPSAKRAEVLERRIRALENEQKKNIELFMLADVPKQ